MTARENRPRNGRSTEGAQKEPDADPKADAPAKNSYVPTRLEAEAARRVLDRRKTRQPMPRMKISDKGADKPKLGLDHGDQRIGDLVLADGLGISEMAFLGGYLNGVIRASTTHCADDVASVNSMLGAIYGMKPCDEAEAMLIAQMVATHDLAMTFAGQAARAENIPQQDAAVNGLTKLTRTYAAQMAELKHYRTGGEQRVIVQRVDVREGGQAVVVGGVNSGRGGGGPTQNGGQSHAKQVTDARGAAMLCEVEAERVAVPSSGGEGPAHLPDARRDQPRGPNRKG